MDVFADDPAVAVDVQLIVPDRGLGRDPDADDAVSIGRVHDILMPEQDNEGTPSMQVAQAPCMEGVQWILPCCRMNGLWRNRDKHS